MNFTSVMLIQEADVEDLQQRDLTTVQVSVGFLGTFYNHGLLVISAKFENAT